MVAIYISRYISVGQLREYPKQDSQTGVESMVMVKPKAQSATIAP